MRVYPLIGEGENEGSRETSAIHCHIDDGGIAGL